MRTLISTCAKFTAGALLILSPVTVSAQIDQDDFKINVSDRDAQPLVRIPPIMPARAERSGHCKVRFDVNPEGAPFNVEATYCTARLFERATIKSVLKWKYRPKIVDGVPVMRTGVENKISFRLIDERGKVIPETGPIPTYEAYSDSEEGCKTFSGVIKDNMHYLPTDGDATYTGVICDGELHGQGKVKFSDGSWYEGTFEEGSLKSGQGYFISDDPEDGIYLGGFKDDDFYGHGTRTYQDDEKTYSYVGNFVDGDEHGQGELKSEHGEWFKGTFDFGDPDTGTGKIDDWGDLEEGSFVNGELHGQGSIHYEDGSWEKGLFEDGMLIDGDEYSPGQEKSVAEVNTPRKVSIQQADGTTYEGMAINGNVPHGIGILKDSDGVIWNGTFENGKFVEGIKTETNGTIHEGTFDGYYLISGRRTLPSGTFFEGEFQYGLLHGEGRAQSHNGNSEDGIFRAGKLYSGRYRKTTEDGQKYYLGKYINGNLDRDSVRCFKERTDRRC